MAKSYYGRLRAKIHPDHWAEFSTEASVAAAVKELFAGRQAAAKIKRREKTLRTLLLGSLGEYHAGWVDDLEFFFVEVPHGVKPAGTSLQLWIKRRRRAPKLEAAE